MPHSLKNSHKKHKRQQSPGRLPQTHDRQSKYDHFPLNHLRYACASCGNAVTGRRERLAWFGSVTATRYDVEGLLGSPTESVYVTDNERVRFDYSYGSCEKGWPYGWNVKPDTVVSITVKPKDTVFLSELKLDYKKYVKTNIPNHTGDLYYIDEDEGVMIQVEAYTGKVMWFIYMPTKADSKLACPDSLESITGRPPSGRFIFKVRRLC